MSIFAKAHDLESTGISFVVVTMLAHRGHAPQDPGAKAIVGVDGLIEGTVGGGKVEAKAILFAQDILKKETLLESEKVIQQKWNLQSDVGMSCGGEVEFLFEVSSGSNWRVVVFGAGHVAQAFIPLLLTMNCHVTCVDQRQEWLDRLPAEFSKLKKICREDLASVANELADELPKNTFYVSMTQGHAMDFPVLQKILSKVLPPFVGVLGSPIKSKKIRKELLESGVPAERTQALHCPVGLPVGANEPSEIAISIAAQLLQVRAEVFDEEKWKN